MGDDMGDFTESIRVQAPPEYQAFILKVNGLLLDIAQPMVPLDVERLEAAARAAHDGNCDEEQLAYAMAIFLAMIRKSKCLIEAVVEMYESGTNHVVIAALLNRWHAVEDVWRAMIGAPLN